LQRLATSRGAECPVLEGLAESASLAARVSTHSALLGVEGSASAAYWNAWAGFLPEQFPFERRSRRPPLNPVNACISFIASMIYHEMVAAVHATVLDPGLGAYHVTEDGRWSLALDLIEPFRPVVVEPLALELFSRGILGAAHFEAREGGVYLNEEGRPKLVLQYEKRLEREFMSEHRGHRTTLRRQLVAIARDFKTALDDPDSFAPFAMN
jgi:CRISPR-associated endonuclease Cas1